MSSTDSQDERTVYSKGKKLKRTTKSMTLVLSDEEAKYRKQNFKNVDVIADYSDKLQCTRCFISIKSAVIEGRDIFCHPLLKVLMCKKCIDFYGSGEFSLDEDDEDKYCRWCGQGGTLLVCSKCICGFCPKCIQKHFGKEKKKQVEKDDDWICFFCKPDWLFDLRAICALAVEASNKNRKELRGKRESRLLAMKGKASTSRSRPKRNTRGSSPSTSTSEKGNTSEPNEIEIISSSDEHEKTDKEAAAEKGKAKDKDRDGEREKSKTPKIVLKRKRGCKIMMACKANGKAYGVDTSSEGTSGETRGRKKLRTSLTACDVKPKEKKEISPKKKLDSDSSSSENEEDPPAATISAPSKQVTKSLNKLTDLFKLTEMTSQLCYNVCKKHIKKLENKNTVITNEKLIKESEKLKTVLTMLSTNLNTVSSTVSSLQNKLGVDGKTIDVANLFSDYSDDSIRGLFALLLRGLEANQTQNQNQLRLAEIVKPSTSPVKDTPVRTVKTPAEKKETLPLPVPEPMSVPTPEPETKPTASPELPEKMEIDEVEEAEALPAKEEKQKPVEDEDVKVDEPKIPEEKKEEEEITERKESKEVSDELVTDEKVEESSEIMGSTSPKDEDMISALEDIFRDDRKKESNKEEGAIANGEPEKSSSKSSGETDGISLKILTQVEKSVLSDLDSEAASQGIEGTCAD